MELEKLLKKEKMDPNVLFPVWGDKAATTAGQSGAANANAKTTPSASARGGNAQPISVDTTSDEEGVNATKMVKKVMNRAESGEGNKNFGLVKYGKDRIKESPESRMRAGPSNGKKPVEELVCTPNVQDMTSEDDVVRIA